MTISELAFKKSGDHYEAGFTSPGRVAVQLNRAAGGPVSVRANIPGMEPTVLGVYENPYGTGAVFEVNVPEGMEVSIRTSAEVREAKLLS